MHCKIFLAKLLLNVLTPRSTRSTGSFASLNNYPRVYLKKKKKNIKNFC